MDEIYPYVVPSIYLENLSEDQQALCLPLGHNVYVLLVRDLNGVCVNVMPGDIPYQVQLPPGAAAPPVTGPDAPEVVSSDPWYTSLWHTIADAPHGVSPVITPAPAPGEAPPSPAPAGG